MAVVTFSEVMVEMVRLDDISMQGLLEHAESLPRSGGAITGHLRCG